jgi:hypothetical protein
MAKRSQQLAERIRSSPAFEAKTLKRLGHELTSGILLSDIARGLVTAEQLADPAHRARYLATMLERLKHAPLKIAISHTGSLRRIGARHERAGYGGLATLLYATWVEHVLNELIVHGLEKAKKPEALAKQVLREASLSAKLGWLLELLGLPPLLGAHVSRLQRLAELRNAFVHYKWAYSDPDHDAKQRELDLRFLAECRKSMNYLARYRARALYNGSKGAVRALVDRKSDA